MEMLEQREALEDARRSKDARRLRSMGASMAAREQRVIALYYYNEVTMKDIGAELGVNESRVSQLHARAIKRLRDALGAEITPMAASAPTRLRRTTTEMASADPTPHSAAPIA